MAKKKKNIKIEKFSPYTCLVMLSIFFGLMIGGILKLPFLEYLPMTNLFGEAGKVKELLGSEYLYNQGDIFRPFFAGLFWICGTLICVFIINFLSSKIFLLSIEKPPAIL